MKYTPNFNPKDDFVIPAGTYVCRVIDCRIGKIQKGPMAGADCLYIKFQIVEGDQEGKVIQDSPPLQGPFAWLAERTIRATMPTYPGGEFDTDDMLGAIVDITLTPQKRPDGSPSRYSKIINIGYHVEQNIAGSLADSLHTNFETESDVPDFGKFSSSNLSKENL